MTYTIPQDNMPKLIEKLNKLAARAENLGLVGPSISTVSTGMQKHDGQYIRVEVVEINFGEEVVVNGWNFSAKIEHLPTGNLVKSFSELDAKWYDAEPNCEHCGQNRRRNTTYVLTNDTREIQVGSTCLKDFTGHTNAEALADYFAQIQEFDAANEFGYDANESYGSPCVEVKKYLQYAALSVRMSGYVSRKNAELKVATADDAFFWMTKKQDHEYPNEKDISLAQDVKDYVEALEPTNNFEHNVKILLSEEYAHYSHFGYIAGALSAHLRNQESILKGAGQEYVGEIKKRHDFTLTVVSERVLEGQYGMTHLYKFTDENGNNLVWFSSKNQDLDIGATYTIKATVKDHSEYNNEKQTVITRGKVL